MKAILLVKVGLENYRVGGIFEKFIPFVFTATRSRYETVSRFQIEVGVIYVPSFVQIPVGSSDCQVEMVWNDPFVTMMFFIVKLSKDDVFRNI